MRVAGALIRNGLLFRCLRWVNRPARLQALSLEVTHDCISQCMMCNIWKIPPDIPNLPLTVWTDLLSSSRLNDLRELDITGGEPFLRPDLLDLFSAVGSLKDRSLVSLRSIAVTTNGFLVDQVLEITEAALKGLLLKSIELIVVCSVDAIGPLHDKIRNHRDAWIKVDATIQGLRYLRGLYPNLTLGLKSTLMPINIGEVEQIAAYAESKGLFVIISPCIISENRYLNPEKGMLKNFTERDVELLIDFFGGDRLKWSYHSRKMVELFHHGVVEKPCTCGFNYAFIRFNGDVYLCPIAGPPVGNVTEESLEDILSSPEASCARRRIGKSIDCQKCIEPGLIRYSLPFEGFSYLNLFRLIGRERFMELHAHMGLNKYVD
jgi:MoaA/NifB/PqqE/SkfB family radical SAM enzyme